MAPEVCGHFFMVSSMTLTVILMTGINSGESTERRTLIDMVSTLDESVLKLNKQIAGLAQQQYEARAQASYFRHSTGRYPKVTSSARRLHQRLALLLRKLHFHRTGCYQAALMRRHTVYFTLLSTLHIPMLCTGERVD